MTAAPEPPDAADTGAIHSRPERGPSLHGIWFVTGPILVVLVVGIASLLIGQVPYYALSPGSARSVEPLITFAGDGAAGLEADEADDGLLFVTVSVSRRPITGFQALYGVLAPEVEVVPEVIVIGTSTPQQNQQFNAQMMVDSQDVARRVALQHLGYEVPAVPIGALIVNLFPTWPAAEVLAPGDTVVAADGRAVAVPDDLADAIAEHEPGDSIELEVLPLGGGEKRKVTATLGADEDDPTVARLGVALEGRFRYDFPFEIGIDSGEVGGPSAGLAFTLAILDRLTPGDLTGPGTVAVTGTIEADGTVGDVGGVDHKARAALANGAELFIVPPREYDAAVAAAGGDLEVASAATLDEVLAVLEAHGGDRLPVPGSDPVGS